MKDNYLPIFNSESHYQASKLLCFKFPRISETNSFCFGVSLFQPFPQSLTCLSWFVSLYVKGILVKLFISHLLFPLTLTDGNSLIQSSVKGDNKGYERNLVLDYFKHKHQ